MKYFLSRGARPEWESLVRVPRRTLFAFDYDGTLVPIAKHPSQARIGKTADALLRALDARVPVAVITGRSVADVTRLLGWRPRYVVGNHGLEGLAARRPVLAEAEKACRRWIRELPAELREWPGVEVEDKRFSISVHFRLARRRAEFRRRFTAASAELDPTPRVIGGKSVFNLVSPGGLHKGTALRALMREAAVARALFVGDDVTDEDVFAMRHKSVVSVRVGRRDASAAPFYLRRQSEVNRLLRGILARVGAGDAGDALDR